jgi:hypothetical protein
MLSDIHFKAIKVIEGAIGLTFPLCHRLTVNQCTSSSCARDAYVQPFFINLVINPVMSLSSFEVSISKD